MRDDAAPSAPYVLGIDPALERTGLATIELTPGGCRAWTDVVATRHLGTALQDRSRRIAEVVAGVRARIGWPVLAVLEAPALAADGGDAWSRAHVWWSIVDLLVDRAIPVATCAPTTLKKWATGHGGSPKRPVEKRHVVEAMHVMWPGMPCTSHAARHHECEALGMAQMAAQRLGWPVPILRRHGEPLAVVKWPQLAEAAPR